MAFTIKRGPQEEPSREPTVVWLGARRGAERLGSSIVQCEGDYRTTAEVGRVFGERLYADRRPGCFSPQDLFSLADLNPSFKEIGVCIA